MTQSDAFKVSVVGSLRALADVIEAGTYEAIGISHGADSLTVSYRWKGDEETQVVKGDPNRPCEHTSRPVTAGGDEVACSECGVVWTP